MARRFKIRDLEQQYTDLESLMLELLTKHQSTIGAARELGISDQTIANWLASNGYERRVVYLKSDQELRLITIAYPAKAVSTSHARITITGDNAILELGNLNGKVFEGQIITVIKGTGFNLHNKNGWNLENLMNFLSKHIDNLF